MSNNYYAPTTIPAFSLARSDTLNNEFDAIEDGFDAVENAINSSGSATSTSTNTIASSGSKAFVLDTGSFTIGQFVLFAETGDPTNWMYGQVTNWDEGTNTVTASMLQSNGSGTISSWSLSLVPPGFDGAYFAALVNAKADIDGETHTGLTTFEACAGGGATTPAAFAFDCSANNFFRKTCTGSHTISFTNVPDSWVGRIRLTNGGLGVLTLPSGSTWAGGAAPTLQTSGVDDLTVCTDDGGTTWDWGVRSLAVAAP